LSAEVLTSRYNDEQIAQYLKHFRADSIGWYQNDPYEQCTKLWSVRDCEAIRETLLGDKEDPDDRKWTIMGQSFGGFCAITYVSFFSEGLKEVFITGGLAPLVDHPDTVYEHLIRGFIS
jgi:hypothetical protein